MVNWCFKSLWGWVCCLCFVALLGAAFQVGRLSGTLMLMQGPSHDKSSLNMAAMAPQPKPWVRLVTRVKALGQGDASTVRGVVTVPLRRDERALMLDATLDKRTSVRLMLDTGATYTTISEDLAEKLGYDLEGAQQVRITTANGQVMLPRIRLKSISLGGYTATNVDATVMPMPGNVPFSGLLGLSFVKNHRITIDTQASHLMIEPAGKSG